MKCQILLCGKNKKNSSKCYLLKSLSSMLNVNSSINSFFSKFCLFLETERIVPVQETVKLSKFIPTVNTLSIGTP